MASQVGTSFGAVQGDFNEDGFVDLAYGPAGVNTVGILLGNGAGGFGAPTTLTIPGAPDAGAVADFDNDGDRTSSVLSHDVAEVWVLSGNGLGGFSVPRPSRCRPPWTTWCLRTSIVTATLTSRWPAMLRARW